MRDFKRRRIDKDDPNSYFVLVGGESRQSQGSANRSEREFLHTSVPFIGQAYQSLREAGIPRERIITICQLDDYRSTLKKGEEGRLNARKTGEVAPKFFQKQLEETNRQCQLLLAEGGADYDFDLVNPETVWNVLAAERSGVHLKVVPKSCSGLFFAIYSHGDSHATTDGLQHDHLTAEWFAHFPYPSQRSEIYDFVATDGAGQEAPYYLYSTQLRLLFHRLFSENPNRPIVGLLNYCTSGGNLEFMRRPTVVKNLGVDQWPLFLMSSSGKSADSLVAGLWQSVFELLSSSLRANINGVHHHQHSLQSLFDAAVCAYHKDNIYDLLNGCKDRAFSEPVWQLDFHRDNGAEFDPWHTDLKDCLLGEDGRPNINSLQELQTAYTSGEAFRVLHKTHADGWDCALAPLPGKRNHVVAWTRGKGTANAWREIGHSQPYFYPITAWQGENADSPVNLANELLQAFDAIAQPEHVCGVKSGIQNTKVADIFSQT